MKDLFAFNTKEHQEFKAFLDKLNTINWGLWPPSETWPRFEGMPNYTLSQYETETGNTFTAVKFDQPVVNMFSRETKPQRGWRRGGGRNDQPSYPQF
jgi:hypothetical protein